jgi:hypothetical protein
MEPGMGLHRYTGTAPVGPWRGMAPPGHCRQCGQRSASCCCGCRECRKEAKELLVTAQITKERSAGSGTAFIGGGCCVTLAVEYAPSVATTAIGVAVIVKDSEGTSLTWERTEPVGTSYRVHECIITTKPGATLTVDVLNGTARVRWCEVFSC